MNPFRAIVHLAAAALLTTAHADDTPQQAIQALPPKVQPQELYKAFSAAKLGAKREDEKTAAFDARVAAFKFKGLTPRDEMMVVLRPSASEQCEPRFDPDHDELTLACSFADEMPGAAGYAIPTVFGKPVKSTFVGANAFNRKVLVHKEATHDAGVLLRDDSSPSKLMSLDALSVTVEHIKSTSGDLKKDYAALELGIIFRAVPPFTARSHVQKDATIDDPTALERDIDLVVGTPTRFIVLKDGIPLQGGLFDAVFSKRQFGDELYLLVVRHDLNQ